MLCPVFCCLERPDDWLVGHLRGSVKSAHVVFVNLVLGHLEAVSYPLRSFHVLREVVHHQILWHDHIGTVHLEVVVPQGLLEHRSKDGKDQKTLVRLFFPIALFKQLVGHVFPNSNSPRGLGPILVLADHTALHN